MPCESCCCGKNHELTQREQNVIDLILAGQSIRNATERTGLSHSTIKTHLRKIYAKLGVTGGTKAVKLLTAELYKRRPELMPFFDGDRAEQIGELSAHKFAKCKLNTELMEYVSK